MKLTNIAAALLAGTAAFVAAPAFAAGDFDGSETRTIADGLTIEQECQIGATAINFGNTGIIDTDLLATSTITIECTKESPYSIGLSAGGSGDASDRTLTDGTNLVHYVLSHDLDSTQNWGFTQGGDTADSASATGGNETLTVYARVPHHQNVPAGTYADTITATIWYDEGLLP